MLQFAVVFPGQGSQSIGMLQDLAKHYPLITDVFNQASEALGYDLWHLTQQGSTEELNQTWRTQPALLAASVAIWRLWKQQGGPAPKMMAGHSLGEYSALVCADVIDFQQAIKTVELRGQLMQQAVPMGKGAMAAILGLDDETVIAACQQTQQDTGAVIAAVNFNAKGQVVIAGEQAAVEQASQYCKDKGAKRTVLLPVSVPSHCMLMKPAAEKLAEQLQQLDFHTPTIPVVNNVDVRVQTSPEALKDQLIRQLYCPVRWTESVEYMAAQHVQLLLEMGPGKVLTGLTKRIVETLSASAVYDSASLQHALQAVNN